MDDVSARTPQATISAHDVVKHFGKKRVVDQLSFDVMPGETFAFLGPNGAGKTTTIKMLTTLLPVDSGQIVIDGFDLARHPMEARRRFGVVFQDCTLDNGMTVHENLSMHCAFYHIPRKERPARIAEALELFDLADRRKDIVNSLSGGLKRRIEIARALLHRPPLIFLDEPTLGLDPKSRRVLWDHLQTLQTTLGTTIFLTTHYLDEVERFARSVAVIDKGRIIAQGSVEAVIRQTDQKTLEDSFIKLTEKPAWSDDPITLETILDH